MRVNKLVNKLVSEHIQDGGQGDDEEDEAQLDLGSLCKLHKRNLKYAEKEIQAVRIKVAEKVAAAESGDNKEYTLRLKDQSRKLIALETLFLNLCPLVLMPWAAKDQKAVTEALEDLEELKECWENLGLNRIPESAGKRRKNSEQAQQEALNVLTDYLTSLLTKPQSYLRDVVNNCFKHFCVEAVDGSGLERLLGIVGTRNQEAGDFMDGDANDEDDEDLDDAEDADSLEEEEEESSGDDLD